MNKYTSFIFKDYTFDKQSKTLNLSYSFDNVLDFSEAYRFHFKFSGYNDDELDRALQTLFFIAGVSYYKAYAPTANIVISKGSLDESSANFFSKTYQRGLGEFWYVNKLDPLSKVDFPKTIDSLPLVTNKAPSNRLLLGLGGGKDSLVSAEALRDTDLEISSWSLNHKTQLEPLVRGVGYNHYYVERVLDPNLLELNKQDALNGHIPISAIFAACGLVVAVLSGSRDIVVSNEQSANEPTLSYGGVAINHQYSKSQEFEKDFQNYLKHNFGDSYRYYSLLRPLSEVRIGELFAEVGFNKYIGVFSSCNRAFTLSSDYLFWCGECPKCAFTFMVLTPFVDRSKLESVWNGKNLLLDKSLIPTYKKLLGIEGDKPLDCVGEIKESRAAMRLCQQIYPDLANIYSFELPADYDYKALGSDEIPLDIKWFFDDFIAKF